MLICFNQTRTLPSADPHSVVLGGAPRLLECDSRQGFPYKLSDSALIFLPKPLTTRLPKPSLAPLLSGVWRRCLISEEWQC